MTALLNWRVWAAIALAVILAATHWKAYKLGQTDIRAEWTAEKLDTARQTVRLLETRDRTNQALQAQADTTRRTKDAQIARITAERDAALDGLRNRPSRPSGADLPTPASAGPASSCTGAQLYREDAGFLVRESARAEALRANLDQCQRLYDAARAALNGGESAK